MQARRHFGPLWPIAFVFLQTWFISSLSSFASFYLFFFLRGINFCPGSEGLWTHTLCHTFVRNHVALLCKTTHTHTQTATQQFFLDTCKPSEFCQLYLVVLSYRIIIRILPSNCMNNFSPTAHLGSRQREVVACWCVRSTSLFQTCSYLSPR